MYFFKRFTLPQGRKFSFSKDICITKPHQSFRFLDKTKKDLKKVFLFLYNYVLTFYTAHCRASCFPLRSIFACRVSSYVTHLTCVLLHSPTISSSGTYTTHLTCELLLCIVAVQHFSRHLRHALDVRVASELVKTLDVVSLTYVTHLTCELLRPPYYIT